MSALTVLDPRDSRSPLRLRRVSVAEYHRMIDDGYLTESDRVELIDGLVMEQMSKNPPHAMVTTVVRERLEAQKPQTYSIRVQDPITLTRSEPEPDLVLVRGRSVDYARRHPGPRDVVLLIEVSDATLDLDRGLKMREYAREQIEPYLIINIEARQAELYTRPSGEEYAAPTIFRSPERCEIVTQAGTLLLDLGEIFHGLDMPT